MPAIAKAALFFIFLALIAHASAAGLLVKHEITINLNDAGEAAISEKYFLNLSLAEKQVFIQNVEKNGKSLVRWKIDYNFIYPRFGTYEETENINVIFDEDTEVLELDYSLANPIATKVREEARTIKWAIPDSFFSSFLSGTTIDVPEDTQILIHLPRNALLDKKEISQEIKLQNSTLLIQDFRGSNLFIFYTLNKPIAPPLGVEAIIREFFANPLNQTIIALIVIALVVLYIYRRPAIKNVEDFIIAHSEIGKPEKEEEIEAD